MADNGSIVEDQTNRCCEKWRKKCENLEKSRTNLRKAVDILNNAQSQSSNKEKKLQNEIDNLKAQLQFCKQSEPSKSVEELENPLLANAAEIARLKECLSIETKRADIEKKAADSAKEKLMQIENSIKLEKSKMLEERRIALNHKNNSEEQKKLAEVEKKKAEDLVLCLENFRKEARESRENLIADFNKKFEEVKKKMKKEENHLKSVRRKAKEQKKIMEEQRKKVMDKEIYANHLSEQLEEEKKRREELQQKLNEIACSEREPRSHSCLVSPGSKSKASDVKLLRTQLKLQKLRVEKAKSIALKEKSNAAFLAKHLLLLQQDLSRLSSHIQSVYDHVSFGRVGTQAPEKFEGCMEIPRVNWESQCLTSKPCNPQSRGDFVQLHERNGFFNNCGLPKEGYDNLQSCRRSCNQPISGISSELESPVGGFQKMSQSSAVCSIDASFSDKKLIGSQGGDALSDSRVTLLRKKLKVGQDYPKVYGENALTIESDTIGFASEDGNELCFKRNGLPVNAVELAYITSISPKKRRKIQCNHVEQANVLENQEVGKSSVLSTHHDSITRMSEPFSAHGLDHSNNLYSQRKYDGKNTDRTLGTIHGSSPNLDYVDGMISGNYMGLLDLENVDDEMKFREAFENPLSPNLPEIILSIDQEYKGDDSSLLVARLPRSPESNMLCVSVDAFIMEVDCNTSIMQKSEGKKLPRDPQQLSLSPFKGTHVNETTTNFPQDSVNKVLDQRGCISVLKCSLEQDVRETLKRMETSEDARLIDSESRQINICIEPKTIDMAITEQKNVDGGILSSLSRPVAVSDINEASEICKTTHVDEVNLSDPKQDVHEVITGCAHGVYSGCIVNFSSAGDEASVLGVVLAVETSEVKDFGDCNMDDIIVQFLHALAFRQELGPEVKASVLFSWIMSSLCMRFPAINKMITNDSLFRFSNAFYSQIIGVLSDNKIKASFLETLQLDVVLSLIQDFLINKKVLYNDSQSPSHQSCSKLYHPDGRSFTYRTATIDQLLSGSIVLASLCSAFNLRDFLLETCYKVLRNCSDNDKGFVLYVLHTWASLCGGALLSFDNYSFLNTAIRLIVLMLEKGDELESIVTFSPCKNCPFLTDDSTMETFVATLTDLLHHYCSTEISKLGSFPETNEAVATNKGLNVECWSSCLLSTYEMQSKKDFMLNSSRIFCNFTNIVSLVELLACYTTWEWTCDNITSRLIKELESCVSEFFSTSLLVLIGELGRIGIKFCGYQDAGVEELRCYLAAFLDRSPAEDRSIRSDFASCSALLSLIPLKRPAVRLISEEDETDHSRHIDAARRWFSKLDDVQRNAFLDLLGME